MTAPISMMSLSAISPAATACCASPMLTDCATSSVKTVARRKQRRLDLLLALGVGAHAGQMRAGAHMRVHQDRREGGGDRDDDVGLGAQAVEDHRLERQAQLGGGLGEVRQHLGMQVPAHHPLEIALPAPPRASGRPTGAPRRPCPAPSRPAAPDAGSRPTTPPPCAARSEGCRPPSPAPARCRDRTGTRSTGGWSAPRSALPGQ